MRRIARLALFLIVLATGIDAAAETLLATAIRTHFTEASAEVECDLYSVDPATGASQLIAPLKVDGGPSIGVISLASHPTTGQLYGVTAGLSRTIPRSLVSLDPQTGTVHLIGPLGTVASDIAFDRRGRLFAWLPDANALARVDLQTGAATPIGPSGIRGVMGGGMVIDDHDVAYVAATGATGTLDTVDIETGIGTTGVQLQGAPYISAITNLTFAPDRTLYAVNSNMGSPASTALVTIDPQSGKVKEMGRLPPDSHALIFSAEVARREGQLRETILIVLGVLAAIVLAASFVRLRGRPH
jgi:hypothetical protein